VWPGHFDFSETMHEFAQAICETIRSAGDVRIRAAWLDERDAERMLDVDGSALVIYPDDRRYVQHPNRKILAIFNDDDVQVWIARLSAPFDLTAQPILSDSMSDPVSAVRLETIINQHLGVEIELK